MTAGRDPMDGFDLPALRRMLSGFEDALREARAASERIEREHGTREDSPDDESSTERRR